MKREDRTSLISMPRVLELLGIGEICYRACVDNGTLPTLITFSTRTKGLYSNELEALITACNDDATAEQMRALVKKIHQERGPLAQNFKRFAV